MKRSLFFLLALLFLLALPTAGCAEKPRRFEAEGIVLDLPIPFEQTETDFALRLESESLVIQAIRSPFSQYENSDITPEEEIADFASKYSQYTGAQIVPETKDDLIYFTYAEAGSGMTHRCFFYRGSDSFWVVVFSATTSKFPALEETVFQCAKGVQVS